MEEQSDPSGGEAIKSTETGPDSRNGRRSRLRRVAAFILIILVLLGGAFSIALLKLNSLIEGNRERIFAQIQQALGRQVTAGSLQVSFLAGGRVQLKDITVFGDPRFTSDPVFRAEKISVSVSLLPLLRKEIRLGALVVRRPEFSLIRNASGELNISTIGVERQGIPGGKASAPSFEIQDIVIENGTLFYRDLPGKRELRFDGVDLEIHDIHPQQAVSFRLRAAFLSRNENLTLEGQAGPLPRPFDWHEFPFDFDLAVQSLDVSALLDAAEILNVPIPLPPDLNIQGPFNLQARCGLSGVEMTAVITLDAEENKIEYLRHFKKSSGVPLQAAAQLRFLPGSIALDSCELSLDNIELNASGDYEFETDRTMRLTLRSHDISLARLSPYLPDLGNYGLTGTVEPEAELRFTPGRDNPFSINGTVTFQDANVTIPHLPKRLTNLNGEIAFDNTRAELRGASATAGDTQFQLSATTGSYSPLEIACTAGSSEFHLIDLFDLPPERFGRYIIEDATATGNLRWQWGKSGPIHPASEQFFIHGDAASMSGTIEDIGYQAFRGEYNYENGRLDYRNLSLQTCEGVLEGGGAYTFTKGEHGLSTQAWASGIDIAHLTRLLNPTGANPPRGHLDGSLHLAAQGSNWDEFQQSLQGSLRSRLHGGRIPGIHMAQFLPGSERDFPFDILDLKADDIRLFHPIAFQIEAGIPPQEESISIQGEAGPFLPETDWKQAPFDIRLTAKPLDAEKLIEAARNWNIGGPAADQLRMQGPLALEIRAKHADGEYPVTISLDATRNTVEYSNYFAKAAHTPLRVEVNLQPESGRMVLHPSIVTLNNNNIDISGEFSLDRTKQQTIAFHCSRIALDEIGRVFPHLTDRDLSGTAEFATKYQYVPGSRTPPQIEGSIQLHEIGAAIPHRPNRLSSITGEIEFHGQRIELKNFTLVAGDSRLGFSLRTDSLSPLKLECQIASGAFNSNDILPASGESRTPYIFREITGKGALDWEWGGWSAPVFDSGRLAVSGTFASAAGISNDLPYENLRFDLSFADRIINIGNLTVQTCGGASSGEAILNYQPAQPAIAARMQLRDLDIERLSRALDPKNTDPAHGRLDSDIELTGSGPGWNEFSTTFKGPIHTEIRNGRLPGINIVQAVLSPVGRLPKLGWLLKPVVKNPVTDILTAPDTNFSEMKADMEVREDTIHISNLILQAPDWSIRGGGDIAFDRTVNATAALTLSPRFVTSLIQNVKDLAGASESGRPAGIPFILRGTISSIQVIPNVESMVTIFPRLLGEAAGGAGGLAKKLLDNINPFSAASPAAEPATAEVREPTRTNPLKQSMERFIQRRSKRRAPTQ